MKLWVLGVVAALVVLVGLPALTLALADDPAPAAAATGPGLGPEHENPGHHYGWTKDRARSDDDDDDDDDGMGPGWGKQMQRAEEWCRTGKTPGPPPWAHGSGKTDKAQKDLVRGFCRHLTEHMDKPPRPES